MKVKKLLSSLDVLDVNLVWNVNCNVVEGETQSFLDVPQLMFLASFRNFEISSSQVFLGEKAYSCNWLFISSSEKERLFSVVKSKAFQKILQEAKFFQIEIRRRYELMRKFLDDAVSILNGLKSIFGKGFGYKINFENNSALLYCEEEKPLSFDKYPFVFVIEWDEGLKINLINKEKIESDKVIKAVAHLYNALR